MVMSRPASFDTPRPRRLTRESILQHVQPASQAIPADRVPSAGEADVCRAARARVLVLGPVQLLGVLRLQLGIVLTDERADFIGHVEQLHPLFLERYRKASEAV